MAIEKKHFVGPCPHCTYVMEVLERAPIHCPECGRSIYGRAKFLERQIVVRGLDEEAKDKKDGGK
jgi:hypothetical protein